MPWRRHQLPVLSPVTARAILGAAMAIGPRDSDRRKLESLLADRLTADRVVLTGSGTQALQLALELAFRAHPDVPRAVALPAFCCYDVATAAVGADARIALYDIDPATLAPDIGSLRRILSDDAVRVAVVAPLYGVPLPWDRLQALAGDLDAFLIEDAAQGHGAAWRGRPLGSLGSMSVVSFGRGKGWTGGGGGALLLRGETAPAELPPLAPAASGPRRLATTAVQWALGRPSLYGIPASIPALGLGQTVYHPPRPVAAMPAASARLALRTREPSDAEAARRRQSGGRYVEELAGASALQTVRTPPDASPGWLRFPVLLDGGLAALADPDGALRRGLGRTYPTTLAELPAVRQRLVPGAQAWPGAEMLARDLVTFPTHSCTTERDRDALVRAVAQGAT